MPKLIPFVLFLLACAPGLSQNGACDDEKLQRADPKSLGYSHQSDGRCEGKFIENDSGGPLWLASFQSAPAHFRPSPTGPVSVHWAAPAGKRIHIRIYSLVRGIPYQMDVERPSAPAQYRWPMDILSRIDGLTADNLGVVASYIETLSTGDLEVCVPAFLQQDSSPISPGPPIAKIVPPEFVLAPKYHVQRIDSQGKIDLTVLQDQPINGSSFPEGNPFDVPLPVRKLRPGLYYVTIVASAQPGHSNPTPAAFAFYYSTPIGGGAGDPNALKTRSHR